MATKQVTISNIKFNLSTEPLVNDPEVYPDYPSVPSQYTSIKPNCPGLTKVPGLFYVHT